MMISLGFGRVALSSTPRALPVPVVAVHASKRDLRHGAATMPPNLLMLFWMRISGNANSRQTRDGLRGGRNAPYILAGWSLVSKSISY
jgi:hypothetical protein